MNVNKIIADNTGNRVASTTGIGGNSSMVTSLVVLEDGRKFLTKVTKPGQSDETGNVASMFKHIHENSKLPVPEIILQFDNLLVLEYISHQQGGLAIEAQPDAARHIAGLHNATSDFYGYEIDNNVGQVIQPNTVTMNWSEFYGTHRLLFGVNLCIEAGKMPKRMLNRFKNLIDTLPMLIPFDTMPSLLHGNLERHNILCDGDKVVCFADPGLYYGHAELDIAFMLVEGKLSPEFYGAYNEVRPLDKEFHEERKWLYFLWPLLLQARIHGGDFVKYIDAALTKLHV